MKRKQVTGYRTSYPKKLIKGTAIAAAAMLAMGGTGCRLMTTGKIAVPDTAEPTPTDELVLDGEVGYDESDLELQGEPTVDEGDPTSEEDASGRTRGDGPALMGKYVVPEETDDP